MTLHIWYNIIDFKTVAVMDRSGLMFKIFSSIKDFFVNAKNIFKKDKKVEKIEYSDKRFDKYLENIDILDPAYSSIKEAIEYCQQLLYILERQIYLNNTLKALIVKQRDLEIFNSFEKEDLQKLQNYIDTYKIVSKETGTLKNQINSYDKSFDYLGKLEKEVEQGIKEMQYYEQRQAGLKRDMAYISGEKEELIYSKEQLEQGLSFLYKFSIVLVCTLAIITFTLFVLKIGYFMEIYIPLAILCVFAIVLGSTIYIFQRKFRYELHRNILLQARAVELLNRTKVLYVNSTSYLTYEYKKFRVRNSEMLQNNWDEYLYQKQISRRHIAMNNRLQEITDNIIDVLSSKGIENPESLFEELINLISLEDKRVLYRDIKAERDNVEAELEDLDIKQEKLWGQLIELQQNDSTQDNIISHIVQAYENENQRINSSEQEVEIEQLETEQQLEIEIDDNKKDVQPTE